MSEAYLKGRITSNDFTYGVMNEYGCTIISTTSDDAFKTFATNIKNGVFDDLFNDIVQNGSKGGVEMSLQNLLSFFNKTNAGLSVLFRPMNDWETGNHEGNWVPKELDNNDKITNSNCN